MLVKDQWIGHHLLFQDKDTLYLAGGYGENSAGELVTYPVVSSVNLPALVDGRDAWQGYFLENDRVGRIATGSIHRRSDLLKLDDGFFYPSLAATSFMGSYRGFETA